MHAATLVAVAVALLLLLLLLLSLGLLPGIHGIGSLIGLGALDLRTASDTIPVNCLTCPQHNHAHAVGAPIEISTPAQTMTVAMPPLIQLGKACLPSR